MPIWMHYAVVAQTHRYRQLYDDTANIQQTDLTLASFGFYNGKLLTIFAL